MQQQALKMIGGMLAVGVVIALTSRNPLPLVVMAVVAYVIWNLAKGLEG